MAIEDVWRCYVCIYLHSVIYIFYAQICFDMYHHINILPSHLEWKYICPIISQRVHVWDNNIAATQSSGTYGLYSISVKSHYRNQCWNNIDWTLGNRLQWNPIQNTTIFVKGVWKSRPQRSFHFYSASVRKMLLWSNINNAKYISRLMLSNHVVSIINLCDPIGWKQYHAFYQSTLKQGQILSAAAYCIHNEPIDMPYLPVAFMLPLCITFWWPLTSSPVSGRTGC